MSKIPRIEYAAFLHSPSSTITYLVWDAEALCAAIVDPVLDFDLPTATISTQSADVLLATLEQRGLKLSYLLETHIHADHLSAADYIRSAVRVPVVVGSGIRQVENLLTDLFGAEESRDDGTAFDVFVSEGDRLPFGPGCIRVMQTPGHTPACITYLVGPLAFVGDALFRPESGTGRTDFPGGDAHELYRSIRRILDLPSETQVLVGHDYTAADHPLEIGVSSVIGQRLQNAHVADGVAEADFVRLRTARDATLPAPALMLPALQVNLRAGALPPPQPNGRSYLKLPLTLA